MNDKKKEIIKHCVAAALLIIIITVVVAIVIKYQVDGETNMPFNLTQITIISTAEGEQNLPVEGEETYKWDFNINQSNDIFFYIEKNENHRKSSVIKSVSIENIKILQKPQKGEVQVYMPNSGESRRYVYDTNFLVNDKLEYKGAKTSEEKNLEIGNQGGKVSIRFANRNVARYQSNDDETITHDGTLLSKTDVTDEELKFEVNFDLLIDTGKVKYKANITLDLPYGNMLEEGKTELKKTDMSDIVFKRI